MDEDDFKSPDAEPEFEHLVPKSFVSSERKIKNRAMKALDAIEKLIAGMNLYEPLPSSSEMLNRYSKVINDISFIIKDVDIHNKRCED